MSTLGVIIVTIFIISLPFTLTITGKTFKLKKLNRTNFLGLRSLESRFSTILRGNELVTEFEYLRGLHLLKRQLTFALFNSKKAYEHNVKLGKIQNELPKDAQFPCNLNLSRSQTPPTTVHKLRPGDIDIIAALGDSMSAGTDLMTENVLQIWYENRGITFSGGGFGNWRKFLTLPNILKVFNPKLYGYAIADGMAIEKTSRFHVAEPTAMSRDLVFQTQVLIRRMRQDRNVNFKHHWKLLTIFIGNVDLCGDLCAYADVSIPLRNHEKDLRKSLSLLRDNVPRLFVNLMSAPNSIWAINKMKVPIICYTLHRLFCGCVINATHNDADRQAYAMKIHLWQDLDAHIASLPEFDTEDFTVVYQPFISDPQLPLLPNGYVDQRYFAADCFHFSQLGHAILANTLWNNMMQPVGNKQIEYNLPFERFECPSLKRPFLATRRNRVNITL